ncbi:MAG: PAS domain S-box protein [Rubrivivax sp.]|nr:PAS domain S-box protein [Rubrivivax sp.]
MTDVGVPGIGLDPWPALAASAAALFDAMDSAVTVWDGELRCLYVNAAAVRMLERPAQELIGRVLIEVMGAVRFREYEAQRSAAMAGQTVELEWQVVRSDGLRTRRLRLLPRRGPDGRLDGFIALTDDVTEALAMRDAVEALAANEAKFRALADSLPVGVYHSDAQARNTYTNARWREIAGLDVEQSLGDGWRDTIHPEDRDAVFHHWRYVAGTGGEFEMAVRLLRPDGTVRHVIGRARTLRGPDGEVTGYVGTNEDVTDRLAAERELRDSQALLDRVGRLANVGGWEVLLPQWELRWTDQTRRILERPDGYRPVIGESRALYRHGAYEVVLGAARRTAEDGTPFDLVVPMCTALGRDIHVRVIGGADRQDGRIVRIVGALQDVTQRHEAELAIERSNRALRMLYEQTPAMLHSIDPEGRLLTVSDQWLAGLGYAREDVIGRLSVDFLTPGSRQAVLAEYLPRLWQVGRSDRLSLQMVRRDGTVLDVLLSAVVERDPESRPLRALAVIEDVTMLLDRAAQLRREQVARRELERQAAELARLASERREMLDLLAHEVRQPLNNASAAIESASAMLADKGETGASARLVRAQGVLSEVQRHVDNTLAVSTLLSSAASPPEEEADIDTVLAVALAELPRAERARVTVMRFTAARSALMDSALVRLALRNLLGNAVRHTAPGTSVTVRISDSDAPLALFIDIVDEGGGLPAELLPRLFERGARIRHPDGRTSHGLGLFIAHRALQVQGGELLLLHSSASGTALRLVLPQGQAG